jgi:hypothetical protein
MVILLLTIGGYLINGYCWLLYYNPLVVILSMAIDGYFIVRHWWLSY